MDANDALPPRPGRNTAVPPSPDDLHALLRLATCGGRVAPRRALLERAGSPQAALAGGTSLWRACGLSGEQVAVLRGTGTAGLATAIDWLQRPGHHLIGWHDPDYPPLLRRIASPPLALFVAGDPGLLWYPAVAIVGSRRPTPAGRDNARSFAGALARSGLVIASGLASGTDTAAHAAALDAGTDGCAATVAVLGTGPDVPYPRSNTDLHARIAANGAIVSEHPPGTGPRKEHFPSRNRILAGLALGTLVIEAAWRSGALITARLAAEAGREVFALPGSIHNPMARGCHRLIRDGAALVESPAEVADTLGPLATALAGDLRRRLERTDAAPRSGDRDGVHAAVTAPGDDARRTVSRQDLNHPCDDPHHNKLWAALGHDPTDMDQLVERSGLTTAQVSSMLLLMELDGRVTVQHGRYFRSH
ncbi:DNA-processing protein DprA [Marilutibacter chinensis]|uniref:DNA-processing protein DprA n=1 Tax=Marilutibacter chinensis TaxID=2912247 RepID=A0ABS9HT79_9GAMM|nr:DNA-processing protein DprA [Lysobacter chinensis]MCF7221565.1 DNA-processing protein DprA [Lysobacter chinensis]